jgi:serine/threonine protein kinase
MGSIPEKAAAFIGREVLSALSYLHENSIVHRDIKAANILLTSEGGVRLGDFGVSGQAGPGIKFAGSPYWMAPEVIRKTRFDAKADIWSFGITMFELLSGNPPMWQLEPNKAMRTIAKSMPPRLEMKTVSKEMRDLVNSCLHDDPDKVRNI